jgi:hypothetical protein
MVSTAPIRETPRAAAFFTSICSIASCSSSSSSRLRPEPLLELWYFSMLPTWMVGNSLGIVLWGLQFAEAF